MNKYNFIVCIMYFLVLSCTKVNIDTQTYTATVNTVNAIATRDVNVKVNFTGKDVPYSTVQTLGFYNYDGQFVNGLLTYTIPANREIPLRVVLSNDSTAIIFNEAATFSSASSHTLFLTGTLQQPEGLLVEDNLPVHEDSTIGIRFINLSPDAGAVSINVAGDTPGSTVSSLSYKSYTDFISFPAKAENQYYLFDISDAATGNLISEIFLDVARMRNETLVLRGLLYNDGPFFEVARIRH